MLTKKLQSLLTIKIVLVFLIIFIAGQVIATEHSFEDPTDICLLCDTADNYQLCLSAAEIAESTYSYSEENLIPSVFLIVSVSGKNNFARAPPQLH